MIILYEITQKVLLKYYYYFQKNYKHFKKIGKLFYTLEDLKWDKST